LEAWNHLEPIWRETNVKIAMHFESVADVFCDPNRLVQVFRNIFENALAVAPNASQIVVATRQVQRTSGRFVQVNITDQGPGLNEEQCKHIFEPFYTTKTKGTGLGMAICQRIINAHQGTIAVGNSDRHDFVPTGATITIELPSKTP
jgi:signal transduction histidine kinase